MSQDAEPRYKTLADLKAAVDRKGIVPDWSFTIDNGLIQIREIIPQSDDKAEYGDLLFRANGFADLLGKLW